MEDKKQFLHKVSPEYDLLYTLFPV